MSIIPDTEQGPSDAGVLVRVDGRGTVGSLRFQHRLHEHPFGGLVDAGSFTEPIRLTSERLVDSGESAPSMRKKHLPGEIVLGIALDDGRNTSGEPMISTDASPTRVRVIRTDEETVIARETIRLGSEHT